MRAEGMQLGIVATFIDTQGGKQRLCIGELRVNGHLGTRMFDGLVDANGFVELHPVLGMLSGDITHRFGDTRKHGGDEHVAAESHRIAVG